MPDIFQVLANHYDDIKFYGTIFGAAGVFWIRDFRSDVKVIKENHLTHIQDGIETLNTKMDGQTQAIVTS